MTTEAQPAAAAADPPAPPAGITQFDYLYDALTQKYPGLTGDPGGAAVFQFAAAPISADWTTGNDAEAYDIANAVPLNLDGFYDKGDSLDTSYQDLIASVRPANYTNNPDYVQASSVVNGLTNSFAQTVANANSAYQEWAAVNPGANGVAAETKTQWLLDPLGGAVWQAKLTQVQTQLQNETSKLAAIVKTMDAALARAQSAASTDTMPISRAGGTAIQVPSVTIGGDLGGDLARWAAYPDDQYDFQVVLDGSYTVKSPWKTLYTTTTSQHCWKTSSTVTVDTSRIIQDVNYKLEVNVVGVESYPITRGAWYDPSYVSTGVQLAPGATVTSDTFFGLAGTLHLIPETLFVMYRPTFKLTISTETYKQQFEANADVSVDWIDLFGFRFNFDGLASLQPVDNGTTTMLTFASPTNASPQIIGVTSKAVWNGSTDKVARVGADAAPRLNEVDPAVESSVRLATTRVYRQSHGNFQPYDHGTTIQLQRVQPFGPGPFVVYNTVTRATLGAGSPPALTAHPPFISVYIPAGVPFTVQNLSQGVDIDVTY